MNNNEKYFKMYIFVFFTIYAFLLLLFCSGASPLIKEIFGDNGYYIYNGRWIQSGNLPYVNFPDTVCKGIYMWFVNYIGTIITPQSFLGNYIIESIFKSIDLCLAYCIFNVYFNDKKKSIFASLLFFLILVSRPCYVFGNQCEQYQLTGFLITILILSKYNQKKLTNYNYEFPMKYMFVIGMSFSFIIGFKMNYILPFIPIAIIIVGDMIIRKKYLLALKNIVGGIIGVIFAGLPGYIYLMKNNLMEKFYERCYLQVVNEYSQPIDIKYIFKFLFSIKTVWLFPLLISSFILIFNSKIIVKINKIIYSFMLVFALIACIMAGHIWSIYYYQLYPYLLPFIYYFIVILNKKNINNYSLIKLLAVFILSIVFNMNYILIHVPGFDIGSTFDAMETFNEFSKKIDNKIDIVDYKIYSAHPQFYVLMNKTGSHLKYVYYPNTHEFINNVETSIKSLENDVLLLDEQQIIEYNIDDLLSQYYNLECENKKWHFKCYIKKRYY